MTCLNCLASCTDYRRQRCSNKWKYYCQGTSRAKRSPNSRMARLFWGKIEKFVRLFSPPPRSSQPAEEEEEEKKEESQSDPVECWRLVRECRWVTYKTLCANKPTTVCQPARPLCREECQVVEYCSSCPAPPIPPSTGAPAPPPAGSFIISPPAPPPPVLEPELIDV